jgi:hypothetical protein
LQARTQHLGDARPRLYHFANRARISPTDHGLSRLSA